MDVVGDPIDILNAPVLVAEKRTAAADEVSEYGIWTFYEIRTIWASCTIRWLGESNGYYSVDVSFERIIDDE